MTSTNLHGTQIGATHDLPHSAENASLDDAVLLRIEDACAWLKIGRTKVFELLASGELESVSVGRARRIPVGSLRAYVTRLTSEAVSRPNFTARLEF